jgi:hypothetical protein
MRVLPVALVLCLVLTPAALSAGSAEKDKPEKPDSTTATRLFNPPRVITPEDTAATGDRPADVTSDVTAGFMKRMGGKLQGEPGKAAKGKCPLCPGDGRGRFGGGGGPVPGYLFADLASINPKVKQMGIPELSENILMVGGKGYARIGHFVIGGGGYAGSTESSGIPDCCSRYAEIEVAYGGVILGLSEARSRCEGTVGILLGGGSVAVERRRNSQYVFGWDDSWDIFDEDVPDSVAADDLNVTSTIRAEFIALEPFVEIKYWVLPFMALDFSASYLRANIGRGKWKIENIKIPDSPEADIGGPTIRLGIHFGV